MIDVSPVFAIDRCVFELAPNARFAAVVARDADNRAGAEQAANRLAEIVERVHRDFDGRDPKLDPAIQVWRQAFSARGWAPSKYLSSIEALIRRVAKGGSVPSINPAVDLANSVSLEFRVPIGVHNLDTAPAGIVVRPAGPDDRFHPMGDGPTETPDPGEIVYVAGADVRTRRWVWRQSRTALVGSDARNILFPIDGFTPETEAGLREAADTLGVLLPCLLGGSATVHYLDPNHPAVQA